MTMIPTRCPHCLTMNRVPALRMDERPSCGHCKMGLMQDKPIEGTALNFDALINSELPVIVDFWAPWCSPCTNFSPVFETMASQEKEVRFVKVDTQEHQQLAASNNIRSIPTLLLFKQGKVVDRLDGALPQAEFKSWLAQAIKK